MQPSPHLGETANAPNPGYVIGQLARALATSESHENDEVRARAARKVESWTQVFWGMLSGVLRIGSRLPVTGVPAWATLEVVKGGFATGQLLAGGELQPHERELLARLSGVPVGAERAALNSYFVSEEGFDELQRLLASGCYRVRLPEEGALLVVAWLARNGHADRARALLDEIGPHFSRLRFYPIPHPRPLTANPVAHLQDVATTLHQLQAIRPSLRVQRHKESLAVWTPLTARVVELFLETVRGPLPSLEVGSDGKPLRTEGKFHLQGGWPCQVYPEGWAERARAVLEDYRRLRAEHQLCIRPDSTKTNFPRLRRYLEQCLTAPEKLTGRDVGLIRSILAGIAAKRGLPGSERWRSIRARHAQEIAQPTAADLAHVLAGRLSTLPRDQGLSSLDEVLAPVSADEASRFPRPAGAAIPDRLGRKLRRSLDAPIEELVEQGIIPSGEVLAQVVPQITSQVRAAGVADADLRRLYGAVYAAFRRRRSLLLLDLSSQVKLEELPWVRAINAFREDGDSTRQQSRRVLEGLVSLALTAFPQQILPNKLLQEVRALADGAGLGLPIVDEVAADIFVGEFTEKFVRAAQTAGEMLEGTLYERYYGLPYVRVRRINVRKAWVGATTSPEFAQLCTELAGSTGSWSVARNGKIIEQQQILTTHNLAVLFDALTLREALRPRLEELAVRCFDWVCRSLQQKIDSWQSRLRMVKNAAYAWRQMIFFLTLAPEGVVDSFLDWADRRLREQRADFQARFRPALEGLVRAARGLPAKSRFLGWTTEKHWLLA